MVTILYLILVYINALKNFSLGTIVSILVPLLNFAL